MRVCACVYVCVYVRESDMVPEYVSNSPSSTDKGVLFGRERERAKESAVGETERESVRESVRLFIATSPSSAD